MSKRRKTQGPASAPTPTAATAPHSADARSIAPPPHSADAQPIAPQPSVDARSSAPAPDSVAARFVAPAPLVLRAATTLTLLLALLAADVPGHRFPALYDAGRFTLAAGALLLLVTSLAGPRLERLPAALLPAIRVAPLALIALGLSALVARHGHDFRLFASAHAGLFGLAPELALVALTTGLALSPHPRAALPLGLGLGLTLALGIAPDVVLGETTFAIPSALTRPAAPLAIAALIALLLAAALAARPTRLPTPLARLLPHTPTLALASALLAALLSEHPLVGLTFAIGLSALHLGLVQTLSAPESEASLAPAGRQLHRMTWLVVLGLWLLIKLQALIASNTDENIYFYMARTLADGQWPYADYFFAHPPLHVVLPGLLFSVFGFSLTFAKVLPLAFCLIGALALHATLARRAGRAPALLGLVLYLFAAEVLKASSNMTGINMTTMFLLLGLWQALTPRPFTSGILLGLAPATGFYAMAPALAILAMCAFSPTPPAAHPERRISRLMSRLRQLRLAQPLAFLLTLGGLNLIFWSIGGDTFLEGVYSYHQQKFFQDPHMVELFGSDPGFPLSLFHNLGLMLGGEPIQKEIFYHPHLWLAFALVPLALIATALATDAPLRRLASHLRPSQLFTSPSGLTLFFWLVALALVLQFAMFRELYSFYFALIYPFLAAASALSIGSAFATLRDRFAGLARLRAAPLALLTLTLVAAHPALSLGRLPVFEDELENAGARNPYEWTPSPVLDELSPIVRNLFWEDFRIKGDVEPGYRHYLWSKKRGFTRLDEVAAEVARLTRPDETIAGSSTLAPLVALLADRRLAANEADTNNKRFRTGILRESDYWDAACRDRLKVIVSAPRSYFTLDKMQALPVVTRYFGRPTLFEDTTIQYRAPFPIALFTRGDTPCAWVGPPTSPARTGPSTPPENPGE